MNAKKPRSAGSGTERVIETPASEATAYGLPSLRWFGVPSSGGCRRERENEAGTA